MYEKDDEWWMDLTPPTIPDEPVRLGDWSSVMAVWSRGFGKSYAIIMNGVVEAFRNTADHLMVLATKTDTKAKIYDREDTSREYPTSCGRWEPVSLRSSQVRINRRPYRR